MLPADVSLTALRLERLRLTWRYAREHSTFYARLLPALDDPEVTLDRLRELPACTPGAFAANQHEMRCGRGLPPFMVFTGGSTGAPRVIYGDRALLERADATIPGPFPRPLTLSTGGGHHGEVPIVPGSAGGLRVPLRSHANYRWACELLMRSHDFPGFESKVSAIFLPLPAVKKLVHFILEQGIDLTRFNVRWVGTYAWYLSNAWRRLIGLVFQAAVVDHFGFTETLGAIAVECPACGHYHYGAEVLPEVVDVFSGQSLEHGAGRLLVTSLYPATEDQILFRYDPGDLVTVGPSCELAGERGFRPLGRIKDALWHDCGSANQLVLVPAHVQEILDFEPLVNRLVDVRFSGITASDDDDFPRWRARIDSNGEGRPTLRIQVELKSSPVLFYDAWITLEREWRAKLLSSNPQLASAVQNSRLDLFIEPLPPNALEAGGLTIC